MIKNLLISLLIMFFYQTVTVAKEPNNSFKTFVNNNAAEYGMRVDEWKQSTSLFVSFENALEAAKSPKFPVSLGFKAILSSSSKNCPDLLHAGFLQEFKQKKKIAVDSGLEIYLLEPPTNSKLSSVYFTYKKGQCLGLFGSAGRAQNEDNLIRLEFFKKIIREY
jgi:hypothetical protein